MSQPVRHVSLAELDEMLGAGVRIAELQAQDYMARGHAAMATHVLQKAIEHRERERSRLIAQSQQAQAPAAAPAPPPPAPQPPSGHPAAPAQNPEERASAILQQKLTPFSPAARALMPQRARDHLIRQAEEEAGIVRDPILDRSQPFGIRPLPSKPRI